MSNALNLSTLANVLDDANAGEFLKSTGSGGAMFVGGYISYSSGTSTNPVLSYEWQWTCNVIYDSGRTHIQLSGYGSTG